MAWVPSISVLAVQLFCLLMATHYFGSIDMAITILPSKRNIFKNKSQDQAFFSFEYALNHSEKFQNYLLGLFQGNKAQICVFLLGSIIMQIKTEQS